MNYLFIYYNLTVDIIEFCDNIDISDDSEIIDIIFMGDWYRINQMCNVCLYEINV